MEPIAKYATKAEPGDGWHTGPGREMASRKRFKIDTLNASHPQVAHAVKMAREWAKRKREGVEDASMILSGPFGTGKTHIAKAILWSMTVQPEGLDGHAVPAGRFYLANDLMQRLAPTRSRETGIVDTPRPSNLVGNAPIVVVDDVGGEQQMAYVGKESQQQEFHARYFRFIDHCYTVMTSVIITTNLSIAGLGESDFAPHIGGRAFDRLAQMAPKGFMVGLGDVPSWRQKEGGR